LLECCRRDWRLEFWSAIGSRTLAFVLLAGAVPAYASVVGTNQPAESITRARIAHLPRAERNSWLKYLRHSERQRQTDKDAFYAEMRRAGIKTPIEPPHDNSARTIPLQTGTESPVFGDRDKPIHDNVNELSTERQNGYKWYSSDPQHAVERFGKWSQEHPESK